MEEVKAFKCSHPGCSEIFSTESKAWEHEKVRTRLPAYKVGERVGVRDFLTGDVVISVITKIIPISPHTDGDSVWYVVRYESFPLFSEGKKVSHVSEDSICNLSGILRQKVYFDSKKS